MMKPDQVSGTLVLIDQVGEQNYLAEQIRKKDES
jgi:hypothetical protein